MPPRKNDRVTYGVATISRLLKNIGLIAENRSLLQGSFAKETYVFKEPTNRSLPILLSAFRVLPESTHEGDQTFNISSYNV